MKICEKYKHYLFKGEWHVHTSYTDGKNTVLEYAEKAVELGIPLLAFTEHVRLNIEYDYDELLSDILIVKQKYPRLVVLSGIEAKILPDGKLDCPLDLLGKVDYKLFAFHSFPIDLNKYISSLKSVLINYPVDAWAHPGSFFNKHRTLKLQDNDLNQIIKLMNMRDVLLEVNFKYKLPNIHWIKEYYKVNNTSSVVFGADVHCVEDLCESWEIKQKFLTYYQTMLSDKIDVAKFMIWFIENYPESVTIMKENPDYQYRFK